MRITGRLLTVTAYSSRACDHDASPGPSAHPFFRQPDSEASKQKFAIDFLQFPRETFQYKAGDCSDISILYSALLQAVGIDAAFITIPGHIFVAVNTGLASEKASAALIPENQYIVYKGKAWIPVEITVRHQGFLKAWQIGAKEWYENVLEGQAGFYPIQEAWTVYQPVGLPGTETTIDVPRVASPGDKATGTDPVKRKPFGHEQPRGGSALRIWFQELFVRIEMP